MAFGLGLLRLPPTAFWAMSLPELDAALRGWRGDAFGPDALDRAALSALMSLYPDEKGAEYAHNEHR